MNPIMSHYPISPTPQSTNLFRNRLSEVGKSFAALELCVLDDTCKHFLLALLHRPLMYTRGEHTGISIAGEVSSPSDESVALVLARSNRVRADGAHNAGVAKGRLGRDNRVGDEVVDALYVYIALAHACMISNPACKQCKKCKKKR